MPVRVLLVEDHPVNQKVVARMLERLSCTVVVADDGEAGVARAKEGFDLIFMDCSMPRMDGFEATRRIRAITGAVAATPIVALTAHATEADRDRCLNAGMNGWIPKPVAHGQLEAVLASFTRWRPGTGDLLVLDEATIDTLLSLGDPDGVDFFASLIDEFSVGAQRGLEEGRAQFRAGDYPAVARTFHRLAGSAATIGATRLHDACRTIERADVADLRSRGHAHLDTVEQEIETSIRALRTRAAAATESK